MINTTKADNQEPEKLDRLPKGALDRYYIEAYLENPTGKAKVYEKAWSNFIQDNPDLAYLLPNMEFARQTAKKMHDRLSEQISEEMVRLSEDDKALGRAVLRSLASGADSESVQAQCATTLSKGLFPDIQITKEMTLEESELAIKQLDKEEQDLRKPH